MQEITSIKFELNAIEGTLLTQDYLLARKRANDIDSLAKENARKIINDAWKQSKTIKEKAFQEGIETGILYCIENIVDHFSQFENAYATILEMLRNEIIHAMNDIFKNNEYFLSLVMEWYKKTYSPALNDIIVCLPNSQKHLAGVFQKKISDFLSKEPKIVFHNYEFIQIKNGDQLIEFDLVDGQKHLFSCFINKNDIKKILVNISETSLKKMHKIFD